MWHLHNQNVTLCFSQIPWVVSKVARIRQTKEDPGFYPEAWQSPERADRNQAARFRVYNRARENFLSIEVAVVDTTTQPLKKLIQDLAVKIDSGLLAEALQEAFLPSPGCLRPSI